MFQYFLQEQILPLLISGFILLFSLLLFNKYEKLSIVLLFIGTLGLGCFIANLDHFLMLWDEQYHALVAKNLMQNPFKPMLYAEPLLDFDYTNWSENHIWVHKQPLFLWQMALSLKIFGISEFAIRIPSIIMHAFIPIFIFRIGKIVLNKQAAFYGALIFAVAYYPLELVAGKFATDHNDIAFMFYVTASLWAWFEYNESQKKYWLVLIGIFSGGAILVKWLVGLLVYSIWGITKVILDKQNRFNLKSYIPILISFIVCLLIFLPWQIYINAAFPKEASYEYSRITDHFFLPVEGHGGDMFFHFNIGLGIIYGKGDAIPYLLLAGIIILFIKIPNKIYKLAITLPIIIVYGFYSIATTKMVGFTTVVTPLIYLGLGAIINSVIILIEKIIKHKLTVRLLSIALVISALISALNLYQIERCHTMKLPKDNMNKIADITEMNFINSLNKKLNNENYVIFNTCITLNGNIPTMFYTNYVAYKFIPTPLQIKTIKDMNRKIAIVDLGNLPTYITNDKQIRILKVEDIESLKK